MHLPMSFLPSRIGFSMTLGAEGDQVLQSVRVPVAGESVVGPDVVDMERLSEPFFHGDFVRMAVLTDVPISALGFPFLRLPVGPPMISCATGDEAWMILPFPMHISASTRAVFSRTLFTSHCGCPKNKGLGASQAGVGEKICVWIRAKGGLVLTFRRTVAPSSMRYSRSNHLKGDVTGSTGNRNLVSRRHVKCGLLTVSNSHTDSRAVPCFGGTVFRNLKPDLTGRTANRDHGYIIPQWRRCVDQTST